MGYEMTLVFFIGIISVFFHLSATLACGPNPTFNYSDPTKWGKLSSDFAMCSNGRRQSPINIITRKTYVNKALKPLESYYRVLNASLRCNGLSLQVAIEGKGEVIIDDKVYQFRQLHWHTPSEHRINGIQFPAELHLVHKADDLSVAVIGILYQYGSPDPLLNTIRPYLTQMYKKHGGYDGQCALPIATLPSTLLKDRERMYYRYSGSFTTPPCTEQVTWSIISKAKTISRKQVGELEEVLEAVNRKNARPVQPLNGRTIQRYL